jgi:hypothetical protein
VVCTSVLGAALVLLAACSAGYGGALPPAPTTAQLGEYDNLYVLSYRDTSALNAVKVVQSLVSIFVESSLGDSRKDSSSERKFIDDQIKTYVDKLTQAEVRLKDFKVRNIELQNLDGRDMAEQLRVQAEQLDQARLELREAETSRDAAKRQIAQEKSQSREDSTRGLLQESALAAATPELDARIEAQKRNLDMLLQHYTDQHTDVESTRRLLAELEATRSKEAAALRKAALQNPAAVSTNTLAFQELYKVLATQEVQVAALRAPPASEAHAGVSAGVRATFVPAHPG